MAVPARTRSDGPEASAAVNEAAVHALSERGNEPRWLREARLAAWDEFESPPPARAERGVRGLMFGDLTAPRLERLSVPLARGERTPTPLRHGASERAAVAVFSESPGSALQVPPSLAGRGVLLAELPSAVREWPDLLRQHLGSLVGPQQGKAAALAAAIWSNGLFVYVPAGVEVELPVRVEIALGSPATALSWRMLVVAERGSRLTLVEEGSSTYRAGGSLFSAIVEVVVGEAASVDYVAVERWGPRTASTAVKAARVAKDGRLRWFSAHLGRETTRASTDILLAEPGAALEAAGLFFADDRQHLDLALRTVHDAPGTEADIRMSGAVSDKAHGAFAGTIRVERVARGAASYLGSRMLTLSDQARVNAIPSLEIEQNDVRVSHGSTAGKLDEEQLFYLMARGLPPLEAKRTLLRGFFAPSLARLRDSGVRGRVERSLERKVSR